MIEENLTVLAKDNLRYLELKEHESWINEGCSKSVDQENKLNFSIFRIQVKG
jgi:hypothetical protein